MSELTLRMMSEVDRRSDELVELLQRLVRLNTVNTGRSPTGNEIEAAVLLKIWLAERGITSRIIEPAPGRGNLIANLRGTRNGPRLMFMGHTDVVPVDEGEVWSHDPFGGEVVAGRLWGRGSLDCKGMVACEALALAILQSAGADPAGELRLAITADEEAGCTWGARWLAEQMPDEVRADYVLNEGPGLPVESPGGLGYLFPTGSKGLVLFQVTAHGRTFHSTQPWRADNALYKIAEVLRRIEHYNPERSVTNPIFGVVDRLAGILEPVTPENVDDVIRRVAPQSLQLSHRLLGLSRLSLAPTTIVSGGYHGTVPGKAELAVTACTLPGQDADTVRNVIEELLSGIEGVEYTIGRVIEPSWSNHEQPFARQIQQAMKIAARRDDIYLAPMVMNGASDTRYIRPLGALCYDFWPFRPEGDIETYRSHCVDESIEIETLVFSTKMMLALAAEVLDF